MLLPLHILLLKIFCIYVNNLRLNALGERPPLHLGLEPHIVDLQGETVSVHDDDNKVILVSCDVSASAQPPLSLASTSLGASAPLTSSCLSPRPPRHRLSPGSSER